MTLWIRMLPTEMKLCCKTLGMAMTTNRPSSSPENSTIFPSLGNCLNRRMTTATASTQLMPWHRKVAQATPATPILKAVTNRMSTAMLLKEDTARKIKGVLLSPRAEKTPVAML